MITKIMKFGGSSVGSAQNINKVIDIVLDAQKNGDRIVVVVSALGGVTDDLIKLTKIASIQSDEYILLFNGICERHNQVIKELVELAGIQKVIEEADKKYNELEEILKNVSSAQKSSPAVLDQIVSFGEQLSAYILSEAIKSRGVSCDFVDARSIIKTDDKFGEANVDIENSYKLIAQKFSAKGGSASGGENKRALSVVGGFIASTAEGVTTTLGRGGSDYTASLVGAALDASVIEIWTDVDGLMTADPRTVKDAVIIPEISYDEAEKMANSGAKVIHPKTMKPARLKNIPIYIKNTFNPKGNGTKIQ